MEALPVVGNIAGALIGSNASEDATSALQGATTNANWLQSRQLDQQRRDNLPLMQTGYGANNLLATLMGMPAVGGAQGGAGDTRRQPHVMPGASPAAESLASIRARLAPQFTGNYGGNGVNDVALDAAAQAAYAKQASAAPAGGGSGGESWDQIRARLAPGFPGQGGNGINDMALDAATNAEYQKQGGGMTGPNAVGGDPSNPLYGLMTKQYTPANMLNDPGYQFRMNEMQKATSRSAAANGSLFSGGFAKALQDRSAGVASQGYNDDFNRFQTERANILNPLLSISGRGQTAIGQVGSAGANYANQVGNNNAAMGGASAFNAMNQGNIWGNAINGSIAAGQRAGWFGGNSGGGVSGTNNGGSGVGNNGLDYWGRYGVGGD